MFANVCIAVCCKALDGTASKILDEIQATWCHEIKNWHITKKLSENTTIDVLVAKNEPTSIRNASHSNSDRIFCFVNDRPGANSINIVQLVILALVYKQWDLNNKLVQYINGPNLSVGYMVNYSSHRLHDWWLE